MHTVGVLSPETPEGVRETYAALEQPAAVVVREVARSMAFDPEEYDRRVTDDVIATAQDALFASLLVVAVGDRAEYDDWRAEFTGELREIGSPNVDRVAWHAFDGRAIATTFQSDTEAAVATLQRQAYGDFYREHLAQERNP